MTRVIVTREIAAPPEVVFGAITDVEKLPETNPEIVAVELLTEQHSGPGTRFRETRRMGKKELVTELEVTELVENERARMVADTHGTIWDTTFTLQPSGAGTRLEIAMEARPHAFLPKLLNPLMKGFFKKGMEKHMDVFAEYCARQAASA